MNDSIESFMVEIRERQGVSPHTIAAYGLDLRELSSWLCERGIGRWVDVDRRAVRSWASWMIGQGYARTSIARKLSSARSFFKFLVTEGLVERSPFTLVPAPVGHRQLPQVLTVDEVVRLLSAPSPGSALGLRDRSMLELLYATGLRLSELLSLTTTSIDWVEGTIRVTGKGTKERIVLAGECSLEAVSRYVEAGRPELLMGEPTDALFVSRIGAPLSVRGFHVILNTHVKAAGIAKRVTPHTIRHTFATHMLEGGADLRTVQTLLGHANVSTTQIYTHVSEGYLRDLYSRARRGL